METGTMAVKTRRRQSTSELAMALVQLCFGALLGVDGI
jgi:hypothetical protein